MVSCPLLTNGSSELGGSLRRSYHREENGCSGCCHPHFSGVCLCCAWSNLGLRQGGVRARTGQNGISLQHWTKLQLFLKWQQSKLNAADKFDKFQTTTAFFPSLVPFCFFSTLSAATIVQRYRSLCSDTSYWFFRKLRRYCAYSSSPFILLVWASATTQSNSCQHPLPELLFSLITIMSGGMGRAGGGLSTHTQPKHRDWKTNFTLYSSFYSNAVVIAYFLTQSCQSLAAFSMPVPLNRSQRTGIKIITSVSYIPVLQDDLPWFNKSNQKIPPQT